MKVLIVLIGAGAIYIGSSLLLDDIRQRRDVAQIHAVMNSPEVLNAQIDSIAEQTQALCVAKGYTEKYCKDYLGH